MGSRIGKGEPGAGRPKRVDEGLERAKDKRLEQQDKPATGEGSAATKPGWAAKKSGVQEGAWQVGGKPSFATGDVELLASSLTKSLRLEGNVDRPLGIGDVEGDKRAPAQMSEFDRERLEGLNSRLSMLARSLSRDFDIRLKAGDFWAYDFRANTISYPIAEMLKNNDLKNIAVVCHELAHRRYSRLPESDKINNSAFHFLWNAVEDIRINKVISERYAGVPDAMRELYQEFTDVEARKQFGGIEKVPKAKQFGLGFIYEWAAGKPDPLITDPEVIDAMNKARAAVKEASRLPPNIDLSFDDMTESEISREAALSFKVIRDQIWPIYEKLLTQDMKEQSQQQGQQGTQGQQGQQGAQGQQGQQGAQGQQGQQGAQGQQGQQGAQGQQGQQGAQGQQGQQGAQGQQGQQGAQGQQGQQGAQGQQGQQGAQGQQGQQGAQGQQGQQGAQGQQGQQGAQGQQGQQGAQGQQGQQGAQGQQGQQGAQGQQGQQGAQGQQGQQGAQGQQGQQGAQGQQGQQGAQGQQGQQGAQGQQGQQGAQGQQGQQGAQGQQGQQGAQGQQGQQGAQGQQGQQGAQGQQGQQGAQGQQGQQGAQGQQGQQGAQGQQGQQGAQGQQGQQGAQGQQGQQGAQGSQGGQQGGQQGAQSGSQHGVQGTQGQQGSQGQPGADAQQGVQGQNGQEGPNGNKDAANAQQGKGKGDGKEGAEKAGKPKKDGFFKSLFKGKKEDEPEIDPSTIPDDPFKTPSNTAGEAAAKQNLDDLFEAAAKALQGKIQAREEEKAEAENQDGEVGGPGGKQNHADKGVDIDELMKAFDKKMKDAAAARNLAAGSPYEAIVKKQRKYIQEMVAELGNFFVRDDIPDYVGGHKSGTYDIKKAVQSDFQKRATGKGDPRIFMKREEPKIRSTEIVFCIDISGSMSENGKIGYAKESLVVFMEALGELQVKHGAIVFNNYPRVIKQIEKDADPKARAAMLPLMNPSGGTDDYAALQAATQMLQSSNANNRVIIYLTDGQGNHNQRAAVEKLAKESNIKVIGIGVGAGTESVKTTYPHALYVPDVENLPRHLGELLVDELKDDE